MIKHSQAHKNSTLQYKIQQSVFRAKKLYYQICPGPADPISGLLPYPILEVGVTLWVTWFT